MAEIHRIDASVDDPDIARMIPDEGGALVAVEGGDLVGSLCFAERGTVAYVWGNYVHPTCQRSGVGTALIRQAAQDMVLANRINLLTVDDGAFAFCRKLGFVDEGPGEVELLRF